MAVLRHSVLAAQKNLATYEDISADQKEVSSGMWPSYFPHLRNMSTENFQEHVSLKKKIAMTDKKAPHRFICGPMRSDEISINTP